MALWKEKACNAFFYLLGKVQPSTRLSHLVPPGDKFTVEAAAEGLFQTWKAKAEEPAERVKQANQMLQWCVQDQAEMVAEATKRGMEEVMDAVPGAPLSGSGVATMPNNTGTRSLVLSDTKDEYERIEREKETWRKKWRQKVEFGRDAATDSR